MNLMLADSERDFLENISERLTLQFPDISLHTCADEYEISKFGNSFQTSDGLCLYNAADFPGLPAQLQHQTNTKWSFWPIRPGLRPKILQGGEDSANPVIYRFDPIPLLADQVHLWLDHRKIAEGTENHECFTMPDLSHLVTKSRQSEKSEAPYSEIERGLHLLFLAGSSGYKPEVSRQRLRRLLDGGCQVIYLPLMPTYQMYCLSPPGSGPDLSDLLLQLMGENIQPNQLGHYLQPHPSGYMQFRPPDRSDDLVLCSPETLRLLVVLLRNYLQQESVAGAALIDCTGIPLASVANVAVLCDTCEILLPGTEGFAARAARREVSDLLSQLPSTCRIISNTE